jgi:hypothetical protein
MSPKEKAEELVLKYLRLQEPNYNWFHKGLAKQCALIAVDEIIRIAPSYGIIEWTIDEDTKEYFELVKKEIEKL